ncbi:uracil-DNA glycosylase [Phaeobacter inhibens]|uniref:uracil-DNA glycosylase family protein n=1 Tax=Phaeobacter inhibens TaxID=221822 RepID=UPI002749F9DC|nr:uracil-DNA glycosylase family protein [Phaeobacter inhibens]GLO69100.1 uracil-DNA glycosylase [Phaeobacter inhibens]
MTDAGASLLAEIRTCDRCAGLPLGPRPIVQFSSKSKLLIVGQAPGRITHHKGIPFDDPSGDRLRQWLGVDRDTFYNASKIGIVPMGFCFPGTGKSGDLAPRAECAPAWRKRIIETLEAVELTLVIGRYAIDWHLPQYAGSTVTDAVKSWTDVWPQKLALPHPSPRNNRWLKVNSWFEHDLIPKLQSRVIQLLQ